MLSFNDINKPNKTLVNNNKNIDLAPPKKKIKIKNKLIDIKNGKQNKIRNTKYSEDNFEDIDSKGQINSDNKIMKENNLRNILQKK